MNKQIKLITCLGLGLLAMAPIGLSAMEVQAPRPQTGRSARLGKATLWIGGLVCAGLLVKRVLTHMARTEHLLRTNIHKGDVRIYLDHDDAQGSHYTVMVWDAKREQGFRLQDIRVYNGQTFGAGLDGAIAGPGFDYSEFALECDSMPTLVSAGCDVSVIRGFGDMYLWPNADRLSRLVLNAHRKRGVRAQAQAPVQAAAAVPAAQAPAAPAVPVAAGQ